MATRAIGKPSDPEKSLRRLGRGVVELLCHVVMVSLILLGIKGAEKLITLLWGEKRLFNHLPVSYIFDAADLMLLGGFLFGGVPLILYAYFRRDDNERQTLSDHV